MSVVDEIAQNPTKYHQARSFRSASLSPTDVTNALQVVAPLFWAWFDQNLDRKIWTVKVWIINKTFTVADLRPLFVILFGQHP